MTAIAVAALAPTDAEAQRHHGRRHRRGHGHEPAAASAGQATTPVASGSGGASAPQAATGAIGQSAGGASAVGSSASAAPTEVASAAPEAPPDPRAVDAGQHFDQGAVFFERGNYEAALAEFQRAYELLEGNPNQYTVLFNIGQAQERLFRYDAAMTAYRQYLDRGGDGAEDRVTVEATIRALDNLLGTIVIATNVPRAQVWLGDREIGTAPGEIRVPGGRHVLQLRAPGYLPSQLEFQIVARARRDLRLTLERVPQQRGISPVFFWGSAGLAVVAAGVGGVFGIQAVSLQSAADAQSMDLAGRWRTDNLLTQQRNIQSMATAADIAFGTAAAFTLTAGVLYFLTDFRGRRARSPNQETAPASPQALLAPSIGPAGASVLWTGVF